MPVKRRAAIRAGPPTNGSSIVLISRPLAGRSVRRSERCIPGLNSPLRNQGNSILATQQSSRLIVAQTTNVKNNSSGTVNQCGTIITPQDDRMDNLNASYVETWHEY